MWEYEYSAETAATPADVWRVWTDMSAWPQWNAGIARIDVDGPLAPGTTFRMTPPDDDPIPMTITEVVPGTMFTDVMDGGDVVVTTLHRLEPLGGSGTRIVYRTEITGDAGPELGPLITADFPAVVAALSRRAEQ
jgi:uncharacterized protein YndB with AHSA1/START domain